jgi:hypothetical protein
MFWLNCRQPGYWKRETLALNTPDGNVPPSINVSVVEMPPRTVPTINGEVVAEATTSPGV